MKAVLCRAYGPVSGLSVETVAEPVAAQDEVVVKVECAGINFPDGLLVQGLYQAKPETPFIPGMEAAGIIESVGANVTVLKPGDRVAVLTDIGGYAEKISAKADKVFPLPESIPFEDACALLCAYGTSHHALKQRASLKPGENLVVLGGSGSTGLAAIQCGKAMGARVIAVASTDAKRTACLLAGADIAIGYDDLKENIRAETQGKGADVIFDPVGGKAFDEACRAIARHGRYLVVGFASGTIPQLPANLALLTEFSLDGVFWGAFTKYEPETYAANMRELFQWHREGKVSPMIEAEAPLEDAPKILERILNRGAIGKSVLKP